MFSRLVALLALVYLLAGCGSSQAAQDVIPDAQSQPRSTPTEALDALLAAERNNDHAASFALLSPAARQSYKDVADWTRSRSLVPSVTGYSLLTPEEDDQPVAEVTHMPGLDGVIGLSAAKEIQTWRAQKVSGGWLLDGDPRIKPVLPDDAVATATARQWAEAVQACDQQRAKQLQAVERVFGTADNASNLCGSSGVVVAGQATNAQSGPQTADLVAQYGPEVLQWARAVSLTVPVPFTVVLAPIGDTWRVVGISNNS